MISPAWCEGITQSEKRGVDSKSNMTIWKILRNVFINSNFHARVNSGIKNKVSPVFWLALYVTQISLCWGKMPDIHNLKENMVYLTHGFSPLLAGSKAETLWWKVMVEQSCSLNSVQESEHKGRVPVKKYPPKTCPPSCSSWAPSPSSTFSYECQQSNPLMSIVPPPSNHCFGESLKPFSLTIKINWRAFKVLWTCNFLY